MKATLLFPTGEARELSDQETFNLRVLCHRFMGLPTLCADMNQVERVLETPQVDTLMQRSTFAAYGLQNSLAEAENKSATSRLEALTDLPLDGPVRGVVLLIESLPVSFMPQLGASYRFAF
jgi:hypothetical protein